MVRDQAVRSAASRILQRAERQDNAEKVVDTFVDVGFLPLLHNQNNQVFYGRRGTGKTHVLRVLETRLREDDERNMVVYIDCRTLGSTSQFSDPTVPLRTRCTALFRDVLGEIHTALLERIFGEPFGSPSPQADRALESLDALSSAIAQP